LGIRNNLETPSSEAAMSRRPLTLSPPPRPVSLGLRLQLLFGALPSIIGFAVLAFGLVFAIVFIGGSEVMTWGAFDGELARVEGTIVGAEETAYEVNEVEVVAYHFTYPRDDGFLGRGVSYTTGWVFDEGAKVPVEYVVDQPHVARIEGQRTAPFGSFVLFVLIFPLVGLFMAVPGLLKGMRAVRLLRTGELGWGQLVAKEETNVEINEQTVYRLTFQFEDARGNIREAVTKTHRPHELEDDAEEPLLYDPALPKAAVLLDNLPGRPEFGSDGRPRLRSVGRLLLVLIAPTIAALEIAWMLLRWQ
jgi:hypothetical protein